MKESFTLRQEQTLALAAAFQAATLVDQLAKSGNIPAQPSSTAIGSILCTRPKQFIDVFGSLGHLDLGLKTLIESLDVRQGKQNAFALRYVMNLIHLERKLAKRPNLLDVISERLMVTQEKLTHFEQDHPNIIGNLADIYSDTIGTLGHRIQVRGEASYLQQPRIANHVRTLLLAGIRAIILWRQKSGSRWHLLLQKGAILENARDLQKRAHDEHQTE